MQCFSRRQTGEPVSAITKHIPNVSFRLQRLCCHISHKFYHSNSTYCSSRQRVSADKHDCISGKPLPCVTPLVERCHTLENDFLGGLCAGGFDRLSKQHRRRPAISDNHQLSYDIRTMLPDEVLYDSVPIDFGRVANAVYLLHVDQFGRRKLDPVAAPASV